jgi:hypothetical protein
LAENAHVKTAENPVGNDRKNLSPLGQKLTAISQNNPQHAKAELGLIGQIVTSLSYMVKHQNISA